MPQYTAPLRDLRFVLHDVFEAPRLWARLPALAVNFIHADICRSQLLVEVEALASPRL